MKPIAELDVEVENHGSIVLVRPVTADASAWIDENVSDEAQWFAGALVVEPRYVAHLLDGMAAAGLTVAR